VWRRTDRHTDALRELKRAIALRAVVRKNCIFSLSVYVMLRAQQLGDDVRSRCWYLLSIRLCKRPSSCLSCRVRRRIRKVADSTAALFILAQTVSVRSRQQSLPLPLYYWRVQSRSRWRRRALTAEKTAGVTLKCLPVKNPPEEI